MYVNRPMHEYFEDLAARKSAPGGGSASALAGAAGAALIEMCAQFTLGQAKYKQWEAEAGEALKAATALRKRFERSIDEDVEAYTKLAYAFKIQKGANLDNELKEATRVPLSIQAASIEALTCARDFVGKCNPNLISDIGVARELLAAAHAGARYSVEINLRGMSDRGYADGVNKSLCESDRKVAAITAQIAIKMEAVRSGS